MSENKTSFPSPDGISWWYQEAMQHDIIPDLPPIHGVVQCDVAIVGGGFTGLWTALLLKKKQPSLNIILIEAGRCGSGASGMNGGKVHGYYGSLATLSNTIGPDGALEAARLGTLAQSSIREYCSHSKIDVWWKEAGNLKVSTTVAQDKKLDLMVEIAQKLGVSDSAVPLGHAELMSRVKSEKFRRGVFLSEGANVQPARLARSLLQSCLQAGVRVFENCRMSDFKDEAICTIYTDKGEIRCAKVVLATNIALASHPTLQRNLAIFSSYAVMSQPIDEFLLKAAWKSSEGISDARMFVHYFRKAGDDRVLMGSGSGPIVSGRNCQSADLTQDVAAGLRAAHALYRLMPAARESGIAKAWGGGIDVSADRLPFFKSLSRGNVFYGAGFSGHGVNATRIAGECLSSLVLNQKNEWTSSVFCQRVVPKFPPEPFLTQGGKLVRASILACEEAEDIDKQPPAYARFGAWLPRALGIRVGMR